MALSPLSFTATQVIGQPSNIVLTDTSGGSDVAVTGRVVRILNAAGNPVVPTGNPSSIFILWPIANATITLNVLPTDASYSVQVDWVNVSNAVLYTLTQKFSFTLYSETFYYSLTQLQSASPGIVQDVNYYTNKLILRCSIDEANQAIAYAGDLFSAQSALNRAAYLIQNQNTAF